MLALGKALLRGRLCLQPGLLAQSSSPGVPVPLSGSLFCLDPVFMVLCSIVEFTWVTSGLLPPSVSEPCP